MFSQKDQEQIDRKGIALEDLKRQIQRFKKGFPPIRLLAPATVSNGIQQIDSGRMEALISRYENAPIEVMKFVPASGAASRMFKALFALESQLKNGEDPEKSLIEDKDFRHFFHELHQFAFGKELADKYENQYGESLQTAIDTVNVRNVLAILLSDKGLGYGHLPKGLLKFHSYSDHQRTAAEEHLYEGIEYAQKGNNIHIHFTVAPESLITFQEHVEHSAKSFKDIQFHLSFSTQSPNTDTIASTTDFKPFRNDDGTLLFRPSGHGALLTNLNELNVDLIFIKNIDNVTKESYLNEVGKYKKLLAGVLLEYQQRAFDLLDHYEKGEDIYAEGRMLLEVMGRKDVERESIPSLLNRPIRVCGMVKNEGEPGGGPFWVEEKDGASLQIVEKAQVALEEGQIKLFETGTHFNPVDIVCGVKDFRGNKFDLFDFRNPEAGFITEKSSQGKHLLAMELPGLWNGSMSDWNTIFVEVPLVTFNPVKTVNDLLKKGHR